MRDYSAVLSRRPGDVRAVLLNRRVRFSQLFLTHMKAEHATMRALTSLEQATLWERQMRTLSHDYSAHIRTWTPARIEAEWEGYRAAVLTLQTRLRARFDWIEREVLTRLHADAATAA